MARKNLKIMRSVMLVRNYCRLCSIVTKHCSVIRHSLGVGIGVHIVAIAKKPILVPCQIFDVSAVLLVI